MSLEVRPVDLASERTELLDILQRNLPQIPHVRRFDWLYRNHPCGQPRSWFAIDSKAKANVGAASLFPRFLWEGGRFVSAGQVGDFAIDVKYRSLGPALMLQRATLEAVENRQFSICYDCPPHSLGMATFRRLGMEEHCEMHRYVRLIRTDRHFQKRFGDGISSRALSMTGNAAAPRRVAEE